MFTFRKIEQSGAHPFQLWIMLLLCCLVVVYFVAHFSWFSCSSCFGKYWKLSEDAVCLVTTRLEIGPSCIPIPTLASKYSGECPHNSTQQQSREASGRITRERDIHIVKVGSRLWRHPHFAFRPQTKTIHVRSKTTTTYSFWLIDLHGTARFP